MRSAGSRARLVATCVAVVSLVVVVILVQQHSAVDAVTGTQRIETGNGARAPLRDEPGHGVAGDSSHSESRAETRSPERGRFVTGTVRSTTGVVIAGASVEGRTDASVRSTKTDQHGMFRVGPFADAEVELRIEHPEFFGIGRRCSATQGRLDVRLAPLGVIFGYVNGVRADDPAVRLTLEVSTGDETGPWRVLEARVPVREGSFRVGVRTRRFVRLVLVGRDGPEAVGDAIRVETGSRHGPVTLR